FLHAQDRFFQMDLLRRQPAGELAELFGSRALESDRGLRLHRFRDRARAVVASEPEDQRALLLAYTAGVNEGLAALDARPFEYVLLRQTPEPWEPEDSLLVVYAMYLDLQDEDASRDSSYGVLHDTMPREMFDFLASRGTEWDAAIDQTAVVLPEVPAAETFSLGTTGEEDSREEVEGEQNAAPGSNNFAVGGSLTSDGRAILAGDMHLGISVPAIWYRASFVYPGVEGTRQITGVTLPGVPAMIVGSNGHVAWAFTNSYGDWVDLVVIDDLGDGRYMTPSGPRSYEIVEQRIRDTGGNVEVLEVRETIWGPVIDEDHRGRPRALRWVAHVTRGINQNLFDLEDARSVESALRIANTIGAPAQNFVVVDREGTIGWTIMGAIPRRVGDYDGRLPQSGADGTRGWDGWLEPDEYPRLTSPPNDRIWTANTRVVGGEMLDLIGDGGYVLGARGFQIREGLFAKNRFDEEDLLKIQLDDRALFLQRWQEFLLEVLDEKALEGHPQRAKMRDLVENWGARASTDSADYRIVRAFRSFLEEDVFEALTARAKEADERFRWGDLAQTEHALWSIVSQRPAHLLHPDHDSWEDQFLATVDETIAYFTEDGTELASQTWGKRNMSNFVHPLAGVVPVLGRFLEYPEQELPGDWNMPRAQGPTFGASQRMVVSPGREAEGIFHMPGGQSGHPLSPHFTDGHDAWVKGEPTPFLPGKTVNTLRLVPATE
ncbi:MAG: penicillin acylase family protein, partial [Acidobacteria bacterium]|nr:penicillin acylase family protein [Acidobacteriota bacterium]